MDLTLENPRTQLVLLIERWLAGKPLKEGEKFKYIPIEPVIPVKPTLYSTPKKGNVCVAAMLVVNL